MSLVIYLPSESRPAVGDPSEAKGAGADPEGGPPRLPRPEGIPLPIMFLNMVLLIFGCDPKIFLPLLPHPTPTPGKV